MCFWNPFHRLNHTLNLILENQYQLMASITERLNTIETKLIEGSSEIIAEIARLREENLSPEGEATLARLETAAQALADLVPQPPTP